MGCHFHGQGVESLEPITLGAVLIAILGLSSPRSWCATCPRCWNWRFAAPGFNAGYGLRHHHHHQISLMLIGGLVGFSMIGIEWSKCSGWSPRSVLVSVLVCRKFSQLYLWPDYPVRKTDSHWRYGTIRDLTGSVTKINTRATTITTGTAKKLSCRTRRLLPSSLQLVAL